MLMLCGLLNDFIASFYYVCFYSVTYQECGRALFIAFIGSSHHPFLSEQSEWAMRKIGHV